MMRAGLLCVRAIHEDGGPAAPVQWTRHPQSGSWTELRRESDGVLLACYRANTNATGTRGLFLVLGPRAVIDAIASSSDYASTLRQLWDNRANATVRAVLRRWPDWRIDGFVRDAEGNPVAVSSHAVRLLASEGFSLPDPTVTPFPWDLDANGQPTTQALAVVRVTAIVRPALLASMALPWTDHEDAEATR